MKMFRKILLGVIAGFIITAQCILTEAKAEDVRVFEEISLGETVSVSFSGGEGSDIYSFTPEKTDVYYLLPEEIDENYKSVLIKVLADPYDEGSFIYWMNVYYDDFVEEYLFSTDRGALILEEGKTYYFKITAYKPATSSYHLSFSLHERPFSIDSFNVENPPYYRGANDACGITFTEDGELFYYDRIDIYFSATVTVVLDGKEYTGDANDVRLEIYDDYGYKAWLYDVKDFNGHYYMVFDELKLEYSVEVRDPIETVSVDDYVLIYSETTLDNCKEYWYFNEPEPTIFYSYGYGYYGDPILTVTAEGKVYSGKLWDVQNQLYEVYGVWFQLYVLPAKDRFEVGTTSLECHFGGVETTMNIVMRDDITEIGAPVLSIKYKFDREAGYAVRTLTWTDAEIEARGHIKYQVYRAEANARGQVSRYVMLGSTIGNEFIDYTAQNNKIYYYRVKAYCVEADISSAFSNVVTIRPLSKLEGISDTGKIVKKLTPAK